MMLSYCDKRYEFNLMSSEAHNTVEVNLLAKPLVLDGRDVDGHGRLNDVKPQLR